MSVLLWCLGTSYTMNIDDEFVMHWMTLKKFSWEEERQRQREGKTIQTQNRYRCSRRRLTRSRSSQTMSRASEGARALSPPLVDTAVLCAVLFDQHQWHHAVSISHYVKRCIKLRMAVWDHTKYEMLLCFLHCYYYYYYMFRIIPSLGLLLFYRFTLIVRAGMNLHDACTTYTNRALKVPAIKVRLNWSDLHTSVCRHCCRFCRCCWPNLHEKRATTQRHTEYWPY